MSPTDAATHLGFKVRVPTGIPRGWQQVRANLKVYRSGVAPQPVPSDQDVLVYNQVWAPPGTDLAEDGACGPVLQVRERLATDGELADPSSTDTGTAIDLGGDHVVYGRQGDVPCGSSGPSGPQSVLSWTSDGILFYVYAFGVDFETVRAVTLSLAE
jgi:hypothetical protein